MNVSELLVEILSKFGVGRMYGIPGDAINHVTDAIRRHDGMRFIQVRHEEAGAFAAGAEAKLTGKLGVCMGTAGPGAVHLLNGLYDAKMDHAPVLAITGHVDTKYMGTDYHQEIDLYSLFGDVAVYNHVVTNAGQLPHVLVQACQRALSERGPAHISLPPDIAARSIGSGAASIPVTTRFGESVPCAEDLDAAAKILKDAGKVTILAGIGCRGAEAELKAFAEKLGAPIVRTLRAKDILHDGDPCCIGGLGNLGSSPGVKAMEDCDAFVMAGTDFPYHDYFADKPKAIQIDVEANHIGRRYPVDVALAGHARATLKALAERVEEKADRSFLEKAQARYAAWEADQKKVETSGDTPIRPQRLARMAGDLASDNAVFVCDTGAVTVWGGRHLRLREGQRYTLSSALASMAFAMPGALGAQLAYPDRQVVALCGDGGFSMLMGDFLTAVKYRLPITCIIFNNGKLGLIQMEQEAAGLPEFETALQSADYAKFAEACGGLGLTVKKPGDLESALKEAYASDKPAVVDVHVNPEEITMPPKIEVGRAMKFGLAKVKEFLD